MEVVVVEVVVVVVAVDAAVLHVAAVRGLT